MSDNNLKSKTINEIINEGYQFIIPDYQRGYRWDESNVEALLEDIMELEYKEKGGPLYCLQPIIMKNEHDKYTLIDGQQRMTTIFFLNKYLNNPMTYSIKFQSKERDEKFKKCVEDVDLWNSTVKEKEKLKNFIGRSREDIEKIKDLGLLNELDEKKLDYLELDSSGNIHIKEFNLDESNIDLFYISKAYRCMHRWFEKMKKVNDDSFINNFKSKLKNQITVIWYEINDSDGHENDVFQRINSGKLKLTNAELIKALIMLDEYCIDKEDYTFDEEKKAVDKLNQLNLQNERFRISRKWDEIETSLRKNDFWLFLNNEKISEKYEDTRIDFIFEIVADEFNDELGKDKIEKANNLELYSFLVMQRYMKNIKQRKPSKHLWNKVNNYYMTLDGWYHNNELYHLIGFQIACGKDIKEILKDFNLGKNEFLLKQKNNIKSILSIKGKNREEVKELLESYEYSRENTGKRGAIKNVLLLFNIVSMMQDNKINNKKNNINAYDEYFEQYSRFPFYLYKKENYDIEHIHALSTDYDVSNEEKKKVLEWALEKKIIDSDDDIEKMYALILSKTGDKEMEDDVYKLNNLTLLDASTNREYKNNPFPLKREYLLEVMSKSNRFIPIVTRNVFLKAYTKDVNDIMKWTKEDGKKYFNSIINAICDYLEVE